MTEIGHGGLRFRAGSDEDDDSLGYNGHEWAFVQLCRSVLPEGGTFVDVGAHVGLFALNLATKAGRVIAVEANQLTYEHLLENISLNEDLRAEVLPVHRAAWEEDEKVLFLVDMSGKVSGGSTRVSRDPEVGLYGPREAIVGESVTVKLDTLLVGEDRVDLIKIDVEGGERYVLDGAVEVLARHRPVLFIEMHDFMVGPGNRAEIERRLDEAQYVHSEDFVFGAGYHWLCRPKETQV